MDSKKDLESVQPENVELLTERQSEDKDSINLQIYNQFASYTEHPEKLLAVLEEHDPGFIKTLNEKTLEGFSEDKKDRQLFAKRQAYVSLGVGVFSVVAIFALAFYMVANGNLGFFSIIALAIFYAITQSGIDGFIEIAKGVAKVILKRTDDKD